MRTYYGLILLIVFISMISPVYAGIQNVTIISIKGGEKNAESLEFESRKVTFFCGRIFRDAKSSAAYRNSSLKAIKKMTKPYGEAKVATLMDIWNSKTENKVVVMYTTITLVVSKDEVRVFDPIGINLFSMPIPKNAKSEDFLKIAKEIDSKLCKIELEKEKKKEEFPPAATYIFRYKKGMEKRVTKNAIYPAWKGYDEYRTQGGWVAIFMEK